MLLCLTNFPSCDFWWGSRLSSTAPDVLSGNGRVFYLQQVLNIMLACLQIVLSSLILVLLALCMKYIHVKISSAMLPEILEHSGRQTVILFGGGILKPSSDWHKSLFCFWLSSFFSFVPGRSRRKRRFWSCSSETQELFSVNNFSAQKNPPGGGGM